MSGFGEAVSRILREKPGGYFSFWCPGCGSTHQVGVGDGPGPRWGYNGNPEAPTFTHSVLVQYAANPDAEEGFEEWLTARTCHSYVTDGRIQFLPDCTHGLAGQTVDLPEFPA